MKTVMVRYKIKPDRVIENRQYIEQVFEALGKTQPAGLKYASFCMEDGVSFVHIASVQQADGDHPLTKTAAFQAFVADIQARCDEPPVAVELEQIGDYRFFNV